MTDDQLIQLIKNENIDKNLKNQIILEFDKRDLDKIAETNKNIDFQQKCIIVATGFFLYKYHLQKSAKLLIKGNRKAYKEYWKFFIYGVIVNIIIFLMVAKYMIKHPL